MKKFEKQIPANNKKWLIENYINQKKSLREIAKKCNVSDDTIRTRLNRFGIKVRGHKEANKISVSKRPEEYPITEAVKKHHRKMKNGRNILCKNCGCSFYVCKGKVNSRKFCSKKCYFEWLKENRIEQDDWRDNPKYNEWRKNVYERDNWKCFICGSKKNINAHHIYNGNDYKEKRFMIKNGITLCEYHHIMLHTNICSFVKELAKQIPNIGETPEKDNPEALIEKTLYAVTTTKEKPERFMG